MNKIQKQLINEYISDAHYLRGKYLNCYSDIEFILLDIINKARFLESYAHFEFKFQRSVSGRIKIVREIISIDGPLKYFDNELEAACACLETYGELRLYFAHGLSRLEHQGGNVVCMSYQRYDPKNLRNQWEPTFAKFFGDDLKKTVNTACGEMTNTMKNLRYIYGNLKLEGPEPIGELKEL